MKTEPTFFKTKAWKSLEKELKKAPKLRIIPLKRTKEEKKTAKLMERYLNYMWETNTNGFTDRFWDAMKREAVKQFNKTVKEIQLNMEAVERITKR